MPKKEPCWDRPRILILGIREKPGVADEARRIQTLVEPHASSVECDLGFTREISDPAPDVAIVIGGDGSILEAARYMGAKQVPILGVNLGKLGFLADLLPGEVPEALAEVCRGHCQVVKHLMYECEVRRDGQTIERVLGLNEVTLRAGKPFRILEIDLIVDGEWVTTYSCDGLIVSTPIGSTAHSLSAGGPILRKDLQAFVVSPLSPHTLTNRPVVDSADRVYELSVRHPHPGTSLVADGRFVTRISEDYRILVRRANSQFKLIQVAGHSYYHTLREKLGWGGRISPERNC